MNSVVCDKYTRRIANEVLYQSYNEKELESKQSQQYINPEIFKHLDLPNNFAIPENIKIPMVHFSLNIESKKARINMRLVYLVNMLEAFAKEYIAERENVDISDVQTKIAPLRGTWQQIAPTDNSKSLSTSFMNVNFLIFVFSKLYNIVFDYSTINGYTLECGSIRNLLVHYNGDINNKEHGVAFSVHLQETLKSLSCDNNSLYLTDDFLDRVCQDISKIIEQCDY